MTRGVPSTKERSSSRGIPSIFFFIPFLCVTCKEFLIKTANLQSIVFEFEKVIGKVITNAFVTAGKMLLRTNSAFSTLSVSQCLCSAVAVCVRGVIFGCAHKHVCCKVSTKMSMEPLQSKYADTSFLF